MKSYSISETNSVWSFIRQIFYKIICLYNNNKNVFLQVFYLIFCRSVWYFPLRLESQLYVQVLFNQIAPDYLEGLLLVLPFGQLSQELLVSVHRVEVTLPYYSLFHIKYPSPSALVVEQLLLPFPNKTWTFFKGWHGSLFVKSVIYILHISRCARRPLLFQRKSLIMDLVHRFVLSKIEFVHSISVVICLSIYDSGTTPAREYNFSINAILNNNLSKYGQSNLARYLFY